MSSDGHMQLFVSQIVRTRALAALVVLNGMLCFPAAPLKKAPELALRLPDGKEQLLSSYRGKVVSLEFIHTTCPHCQQASQIQKRLQQTYADRGFQAVDVAINPNADLRVENFAKDFQLNFPVAWTTPEQALTFLGFPITKLYVVPQIVVIDRMGYIRAETTPKGDDPALDAIRSEDSLTGLVRQLIDKSGRPKKLRR
jgi:peroxiredoxin